MIYFALVALALWIGWASLDTESSDTALVATGFLVLGCFVLTPLWA